MTANPHWRTERRQEWQVDVPEGTAGDVEVRRFEVESGVMLMREAFRGRGTAPGTHTGLYRGGALWMSDTDAERRDHYDAMYRTGRILVHGLGLGCIVNYLLGNPAVEHVDVVDIDPDVLTLIAPHYEQKFPGRFTAHLGDAYTYAWPKGTTFDYIWSDIWLHLCVDNLDEMANLRRRCSRLGLATADRHGCWGRDFLLRQRAHDRRQRW